MCQRYKLKAMGNLENKVSIILVVACLGILSACQPSAKQVNNAGLKEQALQKLDPESIYQTSGEWDNQYGDTIKLSSLAGKIPVISMVFTGCTFSCPRIVADMRSIEEKLPDDKKNDVIFVLVSFDSARDSTAKLEAFSKQMGLDGKWLVLHGAEDDVRELSMLLNFKYKQQPNGDFTHSSGLTLLNTEGVIVHQTEGLGKAPEEMLTKIESL